MSDIGSGIFQKKLTGLDLAMFCFPESQPPDPYNCTLVSLQLLRLLTPVEATTMIPIYPHGVTRREAELHISRLSGNNVEFSEITFEQALTLHNYIFPGFACLLVLSDAERRLNHTVIYWKTITNVILLIDPQTGKIYANDLSASELIRPINSFLDRYGLTRVEVLQYNRPFIQATHMDISNKTDEVVAQNSLTTFFKRGTLIRSGIYPSSGLFPSSEVEMTAGKKSRRTRRRTSRSTKLAR